VNQETTMQTNHTGCDDSPTLGSRLAARAVDVAILAAVDVGLGQLMGFGFDWLALAALTVLVYFAGGDAAFGATPGKRLFGLRVLGPGGCRPTVRQALIRESFTLLGAVPFAGPVLALGAWVWIVLTIRSHPAGQGKHDILAGGTRVIGVRGAPAIGFVLSGFLTSVLLVQGALDARQRARIDQSVDLLVPSAPVVVDVAGTRHLIHELHITNMRPHALSVERLQVTTPASPASLVDLREATLKSAVARVGAPRDAPDPQIIGPGQRAVAYFWIPLRETAPTTVAHRLEIGVQGTPSTTPIVVESAPVTVLPTDPIALDPPLAGGPWIAIYDPELMGGHRTAIYTIDGRARIPGRFAVDWIQAPSSPDVPKTDGFDHTRNGFGDPVLAVADARVAQVVDDMPDLPTGALRPDAAVPLEKASGNYVVLDLGGGRFAFYEHLRRGSITVTTGQRVRVGQVIAQVGSSGSTSMGAHLHFHVADTIATLASEGLPFVFRRVEHLGAYRSRAALLAGESWATSGSNDGARRLAHPAPFAVLQF
jgi:uncharacterized RDD family membrane protein YckC